MKVTVYGAGYVGLVTATCLAELGHQVICLDINPRKISELQAGTCPIYEPGLETLLLNNLQAQRLFFTTDIQIAVHHGDYQFIAVGTPSDPHTGAADLTFVFNVAHRIAEYRNQYCLVINKSTVPIGTGKKIQDLLKQMIVISNPEFLREGSAVADFMHPDRIIIGCEENTAIEKMRDLYRPLKLKPEQILIMDICSAELSKYAANAMLATKISFMNELSHIAEHCGADIEAVRHSMAMDKRIGAHFIQPGCGYGGSCFPKDVSALIASAKNLGVESKIITAVHEVNQRQKKFLFEKIYAHFNGKLKNKIIALWGLAFKPNTDDMREAPSCDLLEALWNAGAKVKAYDPAAQQTARNLYGSRDDFLLCDNAFAALTDADALVIVTEWEVFRKIDLVILKQHFPAAIIFDGRNIYNPADMRKLGLTYYSIGRLTV